jgi:hypothetical protein
LAVYLVRNTKPDSCVSSIELGNHAPRLNTLNGIANADFEQSCERDYLSLAGLSSEWFSRMPASDYLSSFTTEGHKLTLGVIFSVVGAGLILVQSVLVLIFGETVTFTGLQSGVGPTTSFGLGIQLAGIFGIIIAIFILGGAWLVSTPGFEIIGGIVILIFSVLSLFVGGGWFFGLFLGVLGGILGLSKK